MAHAPPRGGRFNEVRMTNHSQRTTKEGFTLIELMTVVAIVAILAAIAIPSYRSYVLRAHRADALSALTQDQAIFERCYAQNFSYSATCAAVPNFPQSTPGNFYSIALSGQTATSYLLTATPINSQAADSTCSTISIDQANQRIGKDAGGTAQARCWNP